MLFIQFIIGKKMFIKSMRDIKLIMLPYARIVNNTKKNIEPFSFLVCNAHT